MFERIRHFCGGLFEKLETWTERRHQRKLELINTKANAFETLKRAKEYLVLARTEEYTARQEAKARARTLKARRRQLAARRRRRITRLILQRVRQNGVNARAYLAHQSAKALAALHRFVNLAKTLNKSQIGLGLAVLFLFATLVGAGVETYYPWARNVWPHTMILSLCCFYLGRLLRKREIFPALRRAFLNPLTIVWFMAWLGYYFR